MGPLILNAFDLIILSQGLNLSAMFERRQVYSPPPSVPISSLTLSLCLTNTHRFANLLFP